MIQMKKTMIALALLTVAGFAGAQTKTNRPAVYQYQRLNNMTPEERGSYEAEKMALELGLSPEQKKCWQMAATEKAAANKPLKEKLRGSTTPLERSKIRAEVHKNQEVFDKKVDSFLNDDQKKKLADKKQNRKESKKRHGHGQRHHEKGNK